MLLSWRSADVGPIVDIASLERGNEGKRPEPSAPPAILMSISMCNASAHMNQDEV
jgi:hypothetical protein